MANSATSPEEFITYRKMITERFTHIKKIIHDREQHSHSCHGIN